MVQPKPKRMTREQKEKKVEQFAEKLEEYPVIGILDMHNLPAKQLQEIKKEMKDFAEIKMSRKTLMDIAIENSGKEDIEKLRENEAVQPAFIFSNRDPFQLYSLIQSNKTSAAAQGGEVAPNDIVLPEGDTGIGPGPMLGKLQSAGAQVQVEDGTIHVQKDAVIVEKGEVIDDDTAEILNQVGIEPLEIGLDLDVAYSNGELFTAEELDIDTEQYRADIESASSAAFNLAVNSGYVTGRTAPTVIAQAVQEAKNLSISEGIPTEDTIEEILAHASSNAEGLNSELELESVDLEEDEDSGGSSETPSSEQGEDEEETEEGESEEGSGEEAEEQDSEDESDEEETDKESDSEDEEEE
ncbi:MAG: 50S ribosomal protein L10 [Candidatus Nanohaloarchaea archaeon]